jgi:hypothetical protein
MRWLVDVGIPVFIGMVICVILFLMKGILGFVIGLPMWMIGVGVIIMGIPIFIMFNMLSSFYRFGKEGFVFMDARRQGKLVICDVEVGTNNAEYILGEKEDPKSPLFIDEKAGVKVDPSMVSAYSEPMRFARGLNIVGYAYNSILPQTNRNHLAFKAIVDYFHAGERSEKAHPAKELAFLTENEKIELISKPEHFLEADLKTKVGKYFKTRQTTGADGKPTGGVIYFRSWPKKNPDGTTVIDPKTGHEIWQEMTVEIPEMVTAVQQMKADINKLPIATGYFSMNEAFKYNNNAYTAQHVSALKNLLTQRITEDFLSKFNAWTYGTILVACLGMVVLGIYVLSQMVFK